MKQTVVAIFDSPLKANEAIHVLQNARFVAERLPRIPREVAPAPASPVSRLVDAIASKLRDFMDADMYLQPYARALLGGRFVVKVYADQALEVDVATKILVAAGGTEIDVLADEWVPG